MARAKLKTREQRDRFLKGVRQGGGIRAGAKQVGVNEATAKRWLAKDQAFYAEYLEAKAANVRAFEAELGWVRPRDPGDAAKGRKPRHFPRYGKLDATRLALFLDGVRRTGSAKGGAKRAGITEQTAATWRRIPEIGGQVAAAIARYGETQSTHRVPWASRAGPVRDDGRESATGGWATMEEARERIDSPGIGGASLATLRRSPGEFFSRVLGWEPWSKQLEIAEAVRDALGPDGLRRVAVRSGNGVGKTAIAARVMLWVLRCWPGSVVITTAPTTRQVDQLLWREARSAYQGARVPLGGTFYHGQSRWELGPRRFALGLSPENTRPERFQGFHADTIVFIIDEASGVPEAHWEAIKGSALAGNAVIFAIGNPTRLHGEFYDAFHSKAHLWRRLHISAFDRWQRRGGSQPLANGEPGEVGNPTGDSPGEVANTVERDIPGLVTPEAIEEARADWGEDSPLWQVRILGQFPTAASNSLIRLEWLEAATGVLAVPGPAFLGVDVARSGEDETAIALVIGNRLERIDAWRGQDTMRTAGAVRTYHDEQPGIAIAVDDGGVGGGVVDRLREMDVPVYEVKLGGSPDGGASVHFKNKLSEIYWALRERLREKRLSLPNDARLWAQLTQVEWAQESDRTIRVYKRGKENHASSPDRADALALAIEAQARGDRGVGLWL